MGWLAATGGHGWYSKPIRFLKLRCLQKLEAFSKCYHSHSILFEASAAWSLLSHDLPLHTKCGLIVARVCVCNLWILATDVECFLCMYRNVTRENPDAASPDCGVWFERAAEATDRLAWRRLRQQYYQQREPPSGRDGVEEKSQGRAGNTGEFCRERTCACQRAVSTEHSRMYVTQRLLQAVPTSL